MNICKSLLFLIFTVTLIGCQNQNKDFTQYVNPFIGTGGHGHTFPGATVPFGMVQLSPDTRISGWDACGGYHYSDTTIIGFSHTHLSGTGCIDYGDILFMPTVGKLHLQPGTEENPQSGYRSRFSHEKEMAEAGYYRVFLDDYQIQVELTATQRVGFHKYTFSASDEAQIIIDLLHGLGPDNVIEAKLNFVNDSLITGLRRSEGWARDQKVYFAALFSRPFEEYGIAVDNKLEKSRRTATGKNIKAYVKYKTGQSEAILVKVGISAVSEEGALKNLKKEAPDWDFERIRTRAKEAWNRHFNKIEVQGGTREQRITFYTALYHAMIAPNLFMDVDGKYRGMDGKIHQAKDFVNYTIFSLWDTFRAAHPLFTIIDQKRTIDFIRTLLAKYQEGGILPIWELAGNYTGTMIGYHAIPVIVDAYIKGIRDFDAELAYQAMKYSAMQDHRGLKYYKTLGYIPFDKEAHQSVSRTVEYAYDDWCIAQMAKALGKDKDFKLFNARAQFYKNVFDAEVGFMRGKDSNGQWRIPFDPAAIHTKGGEDFTEGNSWQYTFFAPQDLENFIDLFGGAEPFVKKLDSLFYQEPPENPSLPDITGLLGQYAQGNEPSHHIAYLYNYAGKPWKTQRIVRTIVDSLYTANPDGLCGNEDCGQMSAWYIFSAMGFYPVCPGLKEYVFGSPVFDKVTIYLENGRQFTIKTENNGKDNLYIQSVKKDDLSYSKTYITHDDILNGGTLTFKMGDKPNKYWGVHKDDLPHSSVDIKLSVDELKAFLQKQ
ncbi:GH92 family glycosyl hydrolase [Caldithrix abyssi]